MAATDADKLPNGVRLRDLGPGDIEAGIALSREAGWNQGAEDWRWMIHHGRGWACIDSGERVVATALTLPQSGSFGWISMVLVTAAWRRHGIASALMTHSIEALKAVGKTPGLDATPAGRAVYGPLGFNDIYGLTRYRAESPRFEPVPDGSGCRPLRGGEISVLASLDLLAFGADRLDLLEDLRQRAPSLAWVHETGKGYCLGRNGRGAHQIGPIVAEDGGMAIALLHAALSGVNGPVMIDVPDRHIDLIEWLTRSGFRAERPYTRMLLGADQPFDDPNRVFAITGPELG
ncbi:MAG: GNAT family N-acetyltransferase [Alphaproteobacteria bacterium]|nr:GNAT family N-acetyltransferase [Alphaproteobacteria bacterium]